MCSLVLLVRVALSQRYQAYGVAAEPVQILLLIYYVRCVAIYVTTNFGVADFVFCVLFFTTTP